MKNCLVCLENHDSNHETCPTCGEASWAEGAPMQPQTLAPVKQTNFEARKPSKNGR